MKPQMNTDEHRSPGPQPRLSSVKELTTKRLATNYTNFLGSQTVCSEGYAEALTASLFRVIREIHGQLFFVPLGLCEEIFGCGWGALCSSVFIGGFILCDLRRV